MHERCGQVEPPLHPARVGAYEPVDRRSDVDELEHLLEPRPNLVRPEPVQAALEREKLSAGLPIVERGVLKGDPDAQPHLLGIFHHVVARDQRGPRRRVEQGAEHPDERGLAGAVRAEETVDLPAADLRSMPSTAGLDPYFLTRAVVLTAGMRRRAGATGRGLAAADGHPHLSNILASI